VRRLDVLAVVLSSALLGACVTADITVTPSGQGIELAARKPDCVVEFHRVRPPERPFDELATLHLQGGGLDAWEAQEALRRRACTLGADAVVVMRDYMNAGRYVVMTGSAVSYPDVRASPAATRARDARGITELMPPPGFSIAVARHTIPLRTTPAPDADAPREVEEGTAI
jgi:hypothetical protein